MTQKPSRLTLLKHSPLFKDLPPETLKALAEMPEDELYMEIAALRVTADHALQVLSTSTTEKDRLRAINACVTSLLAASNAIFKARCLSADAPVLQDLWDAIDKANRRDETA